MTRLPPLLVLLLATACTSQPSGAPPDPGPPPPVYLTGEERGYLEPCGCTRPQLGGLARKGTALGGAPLLENGDLVDRGGRLQELKFETFLMALSEIGCRALNVGEGDLTLGLDFLRSAAGVASFPLISANLQDAEGRPIFPSHADFTCEGRRFRVVGALEPALAPAFRVGDPEAAVARVLDGTEGERIVFLLYHGGQKGARRLAGKFPRLSAVLYAHGGGEPEVRDPRVLTAGDRSRWMVRWGAAPVVVELSERIADHPGMIKAVRQYVRRLTEEDLLHRMNPRAPPEGRGYAGDEVCAMCHHATAEAHEESRHARAIESIRKTGRHVDPDCVGCHVVGYGVRTGFTALEETPGLARVGCESCHGPAQAHVENSSSHPEGKARESCVRCHTADTDPHFGFDERWAKVRHE